MRSLESDYQDEDVHDLVDSATSDDTPDLIDDDGQMQPQLVDARGHWRTWKMDQWVRYAQIKDHNICHTQNLNNETLNLQGGEEEIKYGLAHNFRRAAEIEINMIITIAMAVTVVVEDQNFLHAASKSSTSSNQHFDCSVSSLARDQISRRRRRIRISDDWSEFEHFGTKRDRSGLRIGIYLDRLEVGAITASMYPVRPG